MHMIRKRKSGQKMSFSTEMGRHVYFTKVVTTFTGKGSDTLELDNLRNIKSFRVSQSAFFSSTTRPRIQIYVLASDADY